MIHGVHWHVHIQDMTVELHLVEATVIALGESSTHEYAIVCEN